MIYCLGDMFPLWLRLSFVVIFSFARLFFFWLLNFFLNVFLIFMDYTNISHMSFGRGSAGCNVILFFNWIFFSAISNIHFNVSLTVRGIKNKRWSFISRSGQPQAWWQFNLQFKFLLTASAIILFNELKCSSRNSSFYFIVSLIDE